MNAISRRMKLFCIAVRQLTFVNIGAHEKWVLAERFCFSMSGVFHLTLFGVLELFIIPPN